MDSITTPLSVPATTSSSTIPQCKQLRQPAMRNRAFKQPSPASTTLRFFVVDHPTKLKDKKQLRMNRKHVMQDYLNKERQNPDSTDVRVTGTTAGKKRRRMQTLCPESSTDQASPTSASSKGADHASLRRSSQYAELQQHTRHATDDLLSQSRCIVPTRSSISCPDRLVPEEDSSSLVRRMASLSVYLRTSVDAVPEETTHELGSELNPFDTWPRFLNPKLNTERLKYDCSRHFGTEALAQKWVPTLLKSKQAFLSTLCISASHEDIMRRGSQPPHQRLPFGSSELWAVRGEVISMINKAMKDPKLRATDSTIIAVLHLLNSEIMGCDDATMVIHQRGLHDMVVERGGLEKLGIDGQLSSILTITMYLMSTLRETQPHSDFTKFAEETDTRPSNNQLQLPESPVYCRPSGYMNIARALPVGSPMLKLLEDLRELTNSFIKTWSTSAIPSTPTSEIQSLHHKIWAIEPAQSRPHDFSEARDQHRFEAIRLVGLVYAHALANNIPLSKAASTLPVPQPSNSTSTTAPPSWHVLIKQVLLRTDLSECWGHLAGALFFTTLIAGACANPDAPEKLPRRYGTASEEEEARKWLAAVTVRCSIVLSFEHGGAVLQTLKVLVGIEQALARREERRILVGGVMPVEEEEAERVGPVEVSVPFRKTFQNFARDFLGGSG